MSGYHNNSIFWIETEKIQPNPYQPRREFEPKALEDLADSVRQYGVLQPLVVTRKEMPMENGHGMSVSYELIAGERRLRASKLAGLQQVPVIIRKETDNKIKLELAIIENLQREDLNPIDRALAFEQLYKEFNLTHAQIGKKMGKSRVYVSNSLRLLSLPEDMRKGLMRGLITEGHTRPLLMLSDKPEEQMTLYKEIMLKKMSVRDSEKVARKIAQDKVRKKEFIVDPKIRDYEIRLSENLGTRVHIEPKEKGGKITIDYFTLKDLDSIIGALKKTDETNTHRMMDRYLETEKKDREVTSQKTGTSSASDLMDATPVQVHSNVSESKDLTPIYKELPEFHHNPNEEIQVYKEELALPVEEVTFSPLMENNNINIGIDTSTPTKSLDQMIKDIDNALYQQPQHQDLVEPAVIKESMTQNIPYSEDVSDTPDAFVAENIFLETHIETPPGESYTSKESTLNKPYAPTQNESDVNPLSSVSVGVAGEESWNTSQAEETHDMYAKDPYLTPIEEVDLIIPANNVDLEKDVNEGNQNQLQNIDTYTNQQNQVPQQEQSYTGSYHNPQAQGYTSKKKGFFGNLFK